MTEWVDPNTEWLQNFYKNNPKKNPKNSYDPSTGLWSHEKQQPIRKNVMTTNSNYFNAAGSTDPLFDPFSRTQNSYPTKDEQDKRNKWRAIMNYDLGIADDSNPFMPNPLKTPDFDFGLNMPTFNLAKNTAGVLGGIADTYLGFKTFGLKEDLAKAGMARDTRNERRNITLANNQVDTTNNASDRYNNFIAQYGGPDGKYVKRNQINRIS